MPAAASNCLGGRFWLKLAVFWRFAKNTHALLSIPACSSYSLLFALIFAWIFMAAYAAVETLIITRHADHHFAEVFTLQQADKRLWRIL